jgi:PPOX class probable F420-dependent enzyme
MTTDTNALDELCAQRYISVTTYRRDGTAVATPVWSVPYDDGLAVWTAATAGKVKRIRRSGTVTVAACSMRGTLRGEPLAGQAVLQESADTTQVRALIRKKYGVLGWLATWKAERRPDTSTSFKITLTG